MFKRATDGTNRREERRQHASERGSALVGVLVVLLGLLGLVTATIVMSEVEVRESRNSIDDVRTKVIAESAFERGMQFLNNVVKKTGSYQPIAGLSALFDGQATITPFLGEPMMDGNAQVGAYSVSMTKVAETGASITIDIEATGYTPAAPVALAPADPNARWHALRVTVQYNLAPSEVFDYAYFINNWGWFYGDTIEAMGNVRSNGQFDVAGYQPFVGGQPLYDAVDWNGGVASLLGYRDDNLDGLEDGNDGGVFSGWDIVAAQNVRGVGGNAANQHEFVDKVDMPNLSDLSIYETRATGMAGQITVGGTVMSNAVYGDEAGERNNLYLVGTPADPIVLDGPVVVRGDVIISGYVTGQGAIYSGGNIYCPDSVTYLDPPTTRRPADNTQGATEQWVTDNQNKDFLGLFARENIVVGDYTDSTWRYYVSSWMGSSLNKSEEDAGEDGIPNTSAGRDGIVGTADDDVLEGDGVFSVEYYSETDAALGLIPPGFSIGDPIPGSGEDIDGDGVYDDTTTLTDIDISIPLNPTYWGGNMPVGGISQYQDIASLYANQLDAVFYTNHSFCYLVLGNETANINGGLVSRNENIIYGTPTIGIQYDCRLLGGGSSLAGNLLPQVVEPPTVLRWVELDADPNRYIAPVN